MSFIVILTVLSVRQRKRERERWRDIRTDREREERGMEKRSFAKKRSIPANKKPYRQRRGARREGGAMRDCWGEAASGACGRAEVQGLENTSWSGTQRGSTPRGAAWNQMIRSAFIEPSESHGYTAHTLHLFFYSSACTELSVECVCANKRTHTY